LNNALRTLESRHSELQRAYYSLKKENDGLKTKLDTAEVNSKIVSENNAGKMNRIEQRTSALEAALQEGGTKFEGESQHRSPTEEFRETMCSRDQRLEKEPLRPTVEEIDEKRTSEQRPQFAEFKAPVKSYDTLQQRGTIKVDVGWSTKDNASGMASVQAKDPTCLIGDFMRELDVEEKDPEKSQVPLSGDKKKIYLGMVQFRDNRI
jgi:hypothetical protein